MINLYVITNLVTGKVWIFKSQLDKQRFQEYIISRKGAVYREITRLGLDHFWFQLRESGNLETVERAAKLLSIILGSQVDARGSSGHRAKLASQWLPERRQRQAGIARQVNAIENKKLRDYECPDCGKQFEQVTKGVYGGHRKACLHWKTLTDTVEETLGVTLDEVLDS